jgi:ABC-type transporter Mla subunit MlaD
MIEVRDHLSDGLNRARIKLEARRGMRPAVTVAIGALVALACAGYITAHVSRTLLSSSYEVRFVVGDATGVVVGADDVRFKGIPVGTITKISVGGPHPVLTAKVQKKYRFYQDARAQLRPNTALQDMFIDIVDRGTPASGAADAGHPLGAGRTDTSVNIDDVLGVFNADTRARLRTLMDQLGNGLRDRGARLRTAFVELTPLLQTAGRISDQLSLKRAATRRLIHNAAVLTTDLRARDGELKTLVRNGAGALSAVQSGSGDLDATLRTLPVTLNAIDSSFSAVQGVLGDVDRAVTGLRPVARALPVSLSALQRLNTSAAPAIAALREPIDRLVPFARALVPVSAHLRDAAAAFGPQVHTIDHTTADLAACKKGVQGFFQWDASMSKYGDVRGPVPRGNVVFGAQSSGVFPDPNEYAPKACTAGQPIGGRPPIERDKH